MVRERYGIYQEKDERPHKAHKRRKRDPSRR
jgi:hypothetical protein